MDNKSEQQSGTFAAVSLVNKNATPKRQASVGRGDSDSGSGSDSGSASANQKGAEGEDQDVFFVDGTGRVTAAGGLETGPAGRLTAKGGLVTEGSTVLGRRRATRREIDTHALGVQVDGEANRAGAGGRVIVGEVEVDASLGTFFEVPDDGREGSANILRIKVGVVFFFGLFCCWWK